MDNDLISRNDLKVSAYQKFIRNSDHPIFGISLYKTFCELIDNAQTIPAWIPVSAKSPDKNGRYICTVNYYYDGDNNEVTIRNFNDGVWEHHYAKEEVTAWQQRLPEPYGEGDNNEESNL